MAFDPARAASYELCQSDLDGLWFITGVQTDGHMGIVAFGDGDRAALHDADRWRRREGVPLHIEAEHREHAEVPANEVPEPRLARPPFVTWDD